MSIRSLYLSTRKFQELLQTEVDNRGTYRRPLSRQLWLWRRGFLTRSDYLYDLNEETYRQYLTDLERSVKTKQINGQWNITLDNKLIFHWMLRSFDGRRPEVYGMLKAGQFYPVDSLRPASADGGTLSDESGSQTVTADARQAADAADRVSHLLRDRGSLVLKWIKGGGGNNVRVCHHDADRNVAVVNGERMSMEAFGQTVDALEEYLVCEFVEQSEFGKRLYPDTPNTLRVITMYDAEAGEPFIPIAIHRMGSERSFPMDNFSKGGLNAQVDVETGELGKAVQLPESSRLVRHESHPDSGAPIAGESVPGWKTIRSELLEMAAALPHIPYFGWDVVPTDNEGGFKVIEANSYPGMKALQVHEPLLRDDRTRRFYEDHGALIWDRSN